MADDEFAPDEWDPPGLNAHLPFPPPIGIDLDVFDSFPPLLFLLLTAMWWRGWHATAPGWFWWAVWGILGVWIVNAAIRPQGRRLFAWLPICASYIWLAVRSTLLERGDDPAVHIDGTWTFMLPREEGAKRLANVVVCEDGVLDNSASQGKSKLVSALRWLLALALGQEPLVQLVYVSDTGALDLLDPEAREGLWAARLELLARPDHRMALYLRVRAFPVDDLLRAAGQLGAEHNAELVNWSRTLVERKLILAVPGATRRILSQRLLELLGIGEQPGKLGRAGLYGHKLDATEVRALGIDAWGADFCPTLAVTPTRLEIETGANDPDPIGSADEQPAGGNPGVRRLCTYTITGVRNLVHVGWMEPLTGRRVHCDVAMHIEPIRDSWADSVLSFKSIWWRGLAFGERKYKQAATQASRTVTMIHRGQSSAIRFGLYATVPETHTPVAELALKEMVGKENFLVASLEPLQARMATEPTGRDPLNQRWWTDAQTVAAAWPGTGGVWVDGAVLIGECPRSNEPVGWNPWWEGDETSLGVFIGRSGSGKTNAVQAIAGRMIRPHPDHWLSKRPPPVIVAYLKPYDEWQAFCRYFDGQHYRLTPGQDFRQLLGHADPITGGWIAGDAPMDSPIVAFNMNALPNEEQTVFVRTLEPWIEAHQRPHRFRYPLLYILDEAWALAQDPQQALHLQKYALTVRTLGIGFLLGTQRPKHFLSTVASDVLEQASMWCLMRLRTSERRALQEQLDLGDEAVRILAQIDQPNTLTGGVQVVKGRGIIEAHGIRSTVQVKRFGYEVGLLDQTNPRLRDESWFENDDDDDDELTLTTSNGLVHA